MNFINRSDDASLQKVTSGSQSDASAPNDLTNTVECLQGRMTSFQGQRSHTKHHLQIEA